MAKVSVIVPVYNAGPYFEKRMESLITQTLSDIEIILVLDCPTDGSGQLAEKYAAADGRIMIIPNKENCHVGESRNAGLSVAGGEYVAFADHDDYCEENMYEALYNIAVGNDADIVFSDMYQVAFNGELKRKNYFPTAVKSARDTMLSGLLKGEGFYFSVLNHLYRREFLMTYRLVFADTRKISLEDRGFNLYAYHYARKVVYSSGVYLYHVLYPGSTQHSYEFKSLQPMIGHLEYVAHFFEQYPEYADKYEADYSREVVKRLYYSFLPEIRYKSLCYACRILGGIKHSTVLQKALQNFQKHKSGISFPMRCFFLFLRWFYMPRNKVR